MRLTVKCPDCDYIFKTGKDEDEQVQCSVSNGCGTRFTVKGNLVN